MKWLLWLHIYDTWSSIMKRIMFTLITQARNKLIRWDMCQINPEVGPFGYLSSQKYQRQAVIIHIWMLLRCMMVKIWKFNWKLTILEKHYHFVNISPMKARIFIKILRGGQLLSCELNFWISWRFVHKSARKSCKRAYSQLNLRAYGHSHRTMMGATFFFFFGIP